MVSFRHVFLVPPEIDEKAIRRDTPEKLCGAIAEAKMDRVLEYVLEKRTHPFPDVEEIALTELRKLLSVPEVSVYLLTSDQVAVFDGAVREKPESQEQNIAFLHDYVGSFVETVATTVLAHLPSGARCSRVSRTKTTFDASLSTDEIHRVVARGATMLCCGGFAVEDEDLATHIVSMVPSMEAVQGVDVADFKALLDEVDQRVQC